MREEQRVDEADVMAQKMIENGADMNEKDGSTLGLQVEVESNVGEGLRPAGIYAFRGRICGANARTPGYQGAMG